MLTSVDTVRWLITAILKYTFPTRLTPTPGDFLVATSIIQRLRQNAVNLMVKDQDVKQLADIVAELCMVCEEQQKRIVELTEELESLRTSAVE